ncbi:hypothetical protein LguiA_013258 [Lonicera macranthoides]
MYTKFKTISLSKNKMASPLHLNHTHSHALTLIWPSSHRHNPFFIKQKQNRKNYKTSCVHYNSGDIKPVSSLNDKHISSTIDEAGVTSPSGKAVFTDPITRVATSPSPSNERSIVSGNFFLPPDKVTIKAVVSAKFNQNQLKGFNSIIAKLTLEIVPAEIDPRTGLEKETVKMEAKGIRDGDEVKFEATFEVPLDFGEIGAVISYLPSQTPSGVRRLREKELRILRGDGGGERKKFERIYDYDVYNDLGNPDADSNLSRPVLGGTEYAYPRRCRTGRPRCKTDPLSESRSDKIYLPRDEEFSEVKSQSFQLNKLFAIAHAILPSVIEMSSTDKEFPYFTKIDTLFAEGINLKVNTKLDLRDILPSFIKKIVNAGEKSKLELYHLLLIAGDRFSWHRDEEFCRQTLAGLNPCSIQLLQEWPLRSELDPEVYGPPESAITKEIVEEQIKDFMTFEEALDQGKLFILDYHDLLLQYVNKVRDIKGTTLYGSRTLMFLKPTEELMPVAIELTRPPANKQPQWKQVFTPSSDATGAWLWKLAKTHVLAHDAGYHQLVSHWLRTHCVTEPYIIASNRQLSAMHPIYRLLHPHFRYTMAINAEARQSLINANGTIEMGFSPGKYSMELSSIAYNQWSFFFQGLPADLLVRGMAKEDSTAPHGLKLAIEDYPFASDGLILWDAIKEWVTSYVNYYYPDASLVESDRELQAWWTEIRTVGHGDKKDDLFWPDLNTPNDLIEILTIMIWVTSGHHAAVNFGQYDFAAYFPNRPAIARTKMPTEDPTEEEWKQFIKNPEQALLACLPSVVQATIVMAILDVLSTHSKDEEYIGQHIEPSWEENQILKSSFQTFTARLMELKAIIDRRNADKKLKNRTGAGLIPYELLVPVSKEGVTAQGVPNSISI